VKLLFIDAARKCGLCWGAAGNIPTSCSVVLRGPSDEPALGLGALARWLRDHVRKEGKPDLVGVEKWLPIRGSKNDRGVEDALRLNGVVHGIFGIYGVRVCEPYPSSIRAEVCGRPFDKGGQTKKMVIDMMILRGYLSADCADDNRADACAGFCYLEANFARVPPSELRPH
jgi:hypothetical protein